MVPLALADTWTPGKGSRTFPMVRLAISLYRRSRQICSHYFLLLITENESSSYLKMSSFYESVEITSPPPRLRLTCHMVLHLQAEL